MSLATVMGVAALWQAAAVGQPAVIAALAVAMVAATGVVGAATLAAAAQVAVRAAVLTVASGCTWSLPASNDPKRGTPGPLPSPPLPHSSSRCSRQHRMQHSHSNHT